MTTQMDPGNLYTAINTTDRDVLSSQLLQQQSIAQQTSDLKGSINNTSRYTDAGIAQTDRDVLNGHTVLTSDIKGTINNTARYTDAAIASLNRDVLNGHTALGSDLKGSINNTARYTDGAISTVGRDVLNGHAILGSDIRGSINDTARFTNNMISDVQGELLKGQFDTTITVKDKIGNLQNNMEDRFSSTKGDILNSQYLQTNDLKNNLAALDKDVYTTSALVNENVKSSGYQNIKELGGVENILTDRLFGVATNLASDVSNLKSATDAQFFNNADRIDRSTSELKGSVTSGFYADAMIGKETQRELAMGVGSIEKQAANNTSYLQREIDHHHLHAERRHGEFRKDYFEQVGLHNRHHAQDIGRVELQAAQNYANIQIEALKNKEALGMQAAQNYANSQIELLKTKDALALQAAQNYAASQLQASTNAASIADKLAECCCEIKETVLTTSSATQDAIKASELASVRQQLTAEQTKSFILQTVDKH